MNYRYLVYGLKVNSQIEFDEFLDNINESNDNEVNIIYGEMNNDIKEEINQGRKVFISKEIVWFNIDNIATYLIKDGNLIIIEPYKDSTLKEIKTYIFGACLGHLLYQREVFTIHGGALELNNKALIIVGESGAGKSTLTTALRLNGFGFLSDDLSAIDMEKYPAVNPGYPGQRLCDDGMGRFGYNIDNYNKVELEDKVKYTIPVWESFIREKTEIGMIFEITVDDVEKVYSEKINGTEKLNLLLRNTYCLSSVKHLGVSNNYLKQCIKLAKEVSMFKIVRPRKGFTVNEQMSVINNVINETNRLVFCSR